MVAEIQIREFQFPDDYEGILRLWSGMETGMRVGRSDTAEEIQKKLERDPDLFLVAELDTRLIGSVMGGYDGRRGLIYHLAVEAGFRKKGIASELMSEVEGRLQAKGCVKCYLLVFADNSNAARFYEKRGWNQMKDDLIFGKEFP